MSDFGFPYNVMQELDTAFRDGMSEVDIISRPLRLQDPARTLGIFPLTWEPIADSQQIGQQEPALERYELRIQSLIRSGDEVEGRVLSQIDAKSIRVILYRDTNLKLRLTQLVEERLMSRETFKRYGIRRQNLQNTEIKGVFIYLNTTEFWFENEVVQLA